MTFPEFHTQEMQAFDQKWPSDIHLVTPIGYTFMGGATSVSIKKKLEHWIKAHDERLLAMIAGEVNNLKQETYILEDGKPVELYGYEETFNNALEKVRELLTNHTNPSE